MTEPSCFTKSELAARWKCDQRVVEDMIEVGKIKTFPVGERDRIALPEVLRHENEGMEHETDEEKALAALDRLRPALRH